LRNGDVFCCCNVLRNENGGEEFESG